MVGSAEAAYWTTEKIESFLKTPTHKKTYKMWIFQLMVGLTICVLLAAMVAFLWTVTGTAETVAAILFAAFVIQALTRSVPSLFKQ